MNDKWALVRGKVGTLITFFFSYSSLNSLVLLYKSEGLYVALFVGGVKYNTL